jgi:type I site-specific restriction-modification system R (restriction) subunit
MNEQEIDQSLIENLGDLKYSYRPDIRDRVALERNFREKFDALNRVHLTDGEFQRLLEQITTPDVFAVAHTLRERNSFERDDGTPLNYTLVNIRDWCKNSFEVVNQLRINTEYAQIIERTGMFTCRVLAYSAAAPDGEQGEINTNTIQNILTADDFEKARRLKWPDKWR